MVMRAVAAMVVGLAIVARAGVFSSTNFPSGVMNDTNVGISTNHHFVIAADIVGNTGGVAININGVLFTSSGNAVFGTNWALAGVGNQFGGGGNKGNVTGALTNLFDRFQYGGNPGTLVLSNLVSGQVYAVTFYNETWDAADRSQNVSASGGGSILFQQNPGGGSLLKYAFVATNATESIVVAPVNAASTFHFYGFSERQVFNNQWNAGGGGSLNNDANWTRLDPGTAFGAPVAAGLPAAFPTNLPAATVTVDAATTLGHLQFDGSGAYTLATTNGSALSLQAEPGGVSILSARSGSHSVSLPLVLNQDAVKFGAGTLGMADTVSGAGGLNVQKGTLSLGGTNTYAGATTVAGGTLDIQVGAAIPSGSPLLVTTPATIILSNGVNATAAAFYLNGALQPPGTWGATGSGAAHINDGIFSGPGVLTILGGVTTADGSWGVNSNGTWGLTNYWLAGVVPYGSNSTAYFTNAITADRTVVNTYAPLDLGNLVFGSASNNWTVASNAINLAVNSGLPTITVATNTATISAALAGTQGLAKSGAGSLLLLGANTYAGGTVVSGGRLQIGANGTAGTIAGNLSNDAVVAVSRSDAFTLGGVISGTGTLIQAGTGVTTLTNVNTQSGAWLLTNGTLAVSQDANLGAPSGALTVSGGTLRVTGTALTGLGSRPVNWGTLHGGFDIAAPAHVFTISNAIGSVSTGGNLVKYGAGSLVITNGGATKQIILFHQGSSFVENGSAVTAQNFMSVGQLPGTNAAVTVRGAARLVSVNDLNVGDLGGSTGTLTIADTAAVQGRTLYVGKSGSAAGVVHLTGGSLTTIGGTADWRIGGGGSTNDRGAYGHVRQTGGAFSYNFNLQIGAYGMAQWDLSGGVMPNTGGAHVVARYPGSRAVFNVAGGTFSLAGGTGLILGEQGDGFLNVGAGGIVTSTTVLALGGWQANNENGTGTVSLAAGGAISTPLVRKGATNASLARFYFNGGTLRATANSATHLQGLDSTYVGPGGAVFDAQVFNVTVAQPLLAPAGNGVSALALTNGGTGYRGPPLVTLTGDGTGATAFAQIDYGLGTVTNLVVTSPGVNYTTAAAVLAGGGGSGAGVGPVALAANGSGGLTKLGTGTLNLTATNTYGGNTIISNGTLLVGNTNALGAGTITLASGAAGLGASYPMDQGFINWMTARLAIASSSGVLALGASTSNTLDLASLGGWTLGAAGGSWTFDGSLLVASTNLHLGGGNGTLNYVPNIGTGTNVFIGQAGGNPAGVVVLSGTNDAYAGTILVEGGTLRAGRANAFGTSAVVTVAGGTALDVGGQALGGVQVYAAGSGIGGAGAIVNSGAQQINALQNIHLTGDATFGGPNRWDLRATNVAGVLDLGGFTLTKTNANYIALVNAAVADGSIVVAQGTLSIEGASVVTGGAGGILVQPAGTLGFYALPSSPEVLRPITVNGGTVSCGAGTTVLGAPVTLAGATNTFNTGGFNLVLTGLVGGAGGLLKTGGGTLMLANTAAYTGATVVGGGVLELGSADPLAGTIGASGGLILNGGTALVDFDRGIFGTNLLPITLNTGGTLATSNGVSSAIDGPLKLAGGALGGNAPNPTNGNWRLQVNVAVTTNSVLTAPRIQLDGAGGVAFDVAAGSTLSVASTLEDPGLGAGGTGTLIKAGPGTLTLGATNSYGGATIVSNGLLKLGGSVPAGAAARYLFEGDVTDASGGGNHGAIIGSGSGFVPGRYGQALNLTGSQYVQVPYAASLALTNYTVSAWMNYSVTPGTYGILGTRFGGDNTFDLKYQDGRLHADIGNGTAWLTTAADANVTVPANGWHMVTYVVTNNGCQIYLDTMLVGSVAYSGTPLLMKAGQTMGIGNSFAAEYMNGAMDDVNIYGRALAAEEISALFTLSTGYLTNLLPRATPLSLAAGTSLDLNGCEQSVGPLSGVGSVANSAAAPAVLALGEGDGGGSFSGVIADGAGSVALVKNGTGTQVLHGANSYSAETAVSNGWLLVNGAHSGTGTVSVWGGTLGGTGVLGGLVLNIAGTVAPGASPGVLTILGEYVQVGGLAIEIAGTAPGSGHDQLRVSTFATLGGTLSVTTNGGFAPAAGNTFTVLTASVVGGTFNSSNLPPLAEGLAWEVQYLPAAVVLSVTGAPPPASGYDLFALQITNAADRGYQADPDADGYANLLEYVTGGDPTNADAVARMNASRTNGVLALRFTRATGSADATLHVEGSRAATNNAAWTGIATNAGGAWSGAATVTETGGPGQVNVTVQDTDPAATNRFLRLRVTRP